MLLWGNSAADSVMKGSIAVVLLAAGMLAVHATPSLPRCCYTLAGVPYPPGDCTCLNDDVELSHQFVAQGQVKKYHWVMTNWAAINVPDSVRGARDAPLPWCCLRTRQS